MVSLNHVELDVTAPNDVRTRRHFDILTADERTWTICRLADEGYSDYGIAAATRLSVDMVRRLLSERRNPT